MNLEPLETLGAKPETDASAEQVFHAMSALFAAPGGPEALVGRFASTPHAVLARTLMFLLARAASAQSVRGALLLRAVEDLRSDDDGARMNLLTAVQLSAMHADLLAPGAPCPGQLLDFLIESAGRSERVQSVLVAAVRVLHVHRRLAGGVRVDALRTVLGALKPEPHSLLWLELADLRPFLASTG